MAPAVFPQPRAADRFRQCVSSQAPGLSAFATVARPGVSGSPPFGLGGGRGSATSGTLLRPFHLITRRVLRGDAPSSGCDSAKDAPRVFLFARCSYFVGRSGRGVLLSQIFMGVDLREEKAICNCSIRAFLFEEGNPMYTILETGICFLSVRWSVSAYSSVTALRDETPVVSPGWIIRQRAAHISISMGSRTTCAWNVRTFSRLFKEAPPVFKLLCEPALGPL